jgi:hypothetical protein
MNVGMNVPATAVPQTSQASRNRQLGQPSPTTSSTTSSTQATRDKHSCDDTFDEDLFANDGPEEREDVVEHEPSNEIPDTSSCGRLIPEIYSRPTSSALQVGESSRSMASVHSVHVSNFSEAMMEALRAISEKDTKDDMKKLTDHLTAITHCEHVVSVQSIPWFQYCLKL